MTTLPPPTGDCLVLKSNRSAVDRTFRPIVVMYAIVTTALCALIVWAATLIGELAPLALFLLVPVIMAGSLSVYCYSWGATRAIEWPLQISRAGMLFCTPRGRVEFGWEAVTDVRITQHRLTQQLTVRLHPNAGPGAPGVVTTVPEGGWRLIRRSGVRLSLRVVTCDPTDLAAAIAALSGHRWTPQPPG